jgi:hypothetical protein
LAIPHRAANFDLEDASAIIDWTHEREWRVPGDLKFSLSDVSVIVPNKTAYQRFIKKCLAENQTEILTAINGIVQLGAVFF